MSNIRVIRPNITSETFKTYGMNNDLRDFATDKFDNLLVIVAQQWHNLQHLVAKMLNVQAHLT